MTDIRNNPVAYATQAPWPADLTPYQQVFIATLRTGYAEAAYFDGAHVQHIADWQEHQRLTRLREQAVRAVEGRRA